MMEIGREACVVFHRAELGVLAEGAVAAGTQGDFCMLTDFAAATRDQVDHTADGIGAVDAGARTTHDLDTLDGGEWQEFEMRQAIGTVGDTLAIDQNQGVVGLGTAHEEAGLAAHRAAAGDLDAIA